MSKRICILLFILLCSKHLIQAQSNYYDDDAALWLKLELDKKMGDRFSFQWSNQIRVNNNITQFGQVASDIGFQYKVHKQFKMLMGYVWRENRILNGSYLTSQQVYTGFVFSQHFKRFTVQYRFRMQNQWKAVEQSKESFITNSVIRNKVKVEYELNKRWMPFVAVELSQSLYLLSMYPKSRSRYYFGTTFKPMQSHKVEVYFMLQNYSVYKNQPKRFFVYGITYNISF